MFLTFLQMDFREFFGWVIFSVLKISKNSLLKNELSQLSILQIAYYSSMNLSKN